MPSLYALLLYYTAYYVGLLTFSRYLSCGRVKAGTAHELPCYSEAAGSNPIALRSLTLLSHTTPGKPLRPPFLAVGRSLYPGLGE